MLANLNENFRQYSRRNEFMRLKIIFFFVKYTLLAAV